MRDLMRDLLRDIRHALRVLRRRPSYTLITILTLTIGIGGVAAAFTVLHGVVLRPLPFRDADRLAVLWSINLKQPDDRDPLRLADILTYPRQTRVLEDVAYFRFWGLTLTGSGDAEELVTARVSPNFFGLLGARPLFGEAFRSSHGEPGNDRVVILSHKTWQRRFGGDRSLIGRSLRLDGEQYTVLGVMAPEFEFPDESVQLWTPLVVPAQAMNRPRRDTMAVARLRGDATLAQAQSEVTRVAAVLAQERPDTNAGRGAVLVLVRDQLMKDVRRPLVILFAAACLVCLVALINVTSLQIAEALARRTELAVRSALGASAGRLARAFVIENLLLTIAGGAAALMLVTWVVPAALALTPTELPRAPHVRVDWRVVLLVFTLGVAAAFAIGMTSAARALRGAAAWLKEGDARAGRVSPGAYRLRRLLVVAEIALALVALVCGALLIRSMQRLESVNPGFEPNRVTTVQLFLPQNKYPGGEQRVSFLDRLIERTRAVPDVTSVAAVTVLPGGSTGANIDLPFTIEGRPPRTDAPQADIRAATAGYFQTMGIPLLRGRPITDDDRPGTSGVAVISEALARREWGDADPIGARLVLDLRGPKTFDIVGVAGDVRHGGLDKAPRPTIYLSYRQQSSASVSLVVKSANGREALGSALRAQVTAVDADQAVYAIGSMRAVVDDWLKGARFSALLLTLLGLSALVLSAAGVYGFMHAAVQDRTHDIGVRLAIGGQPRDVLTMVLGDSVRLMALGLIAGAAAAWGAARVLAGLLFGITPNDPVSFAAGALVLGAVAIVAAYLPARRATRIDPVQVLRGTPRP